MTFGRLLFGSVMTLLTAGAACSGPAGRENEASGSVEIFSWWTSGGEADALGAVIDLHEERVPHATVVNAAVDFAEKAREQLQQRMEAGAPPDLFQANIGADLFKWVLLNGSDDTDARVEDLTALAEEKGWLEAFDPDVLEAASFDGKLYGLPVNVHRLNSLFYRKDLFEAYDLQPPTTVAELIGLCEAIEEKVELQAESPTGTMSCLGLGNKWNWTLSMVTFEMIFPAVAGADYYESFWLGEKSATDPELTQALDLALELFCGGTDTTDCEATSFFNRDFGEVDWDVGVGALIEKSAMMAPMGDWAKGFLEAEGLEPNVDFGVVPFPGSSGICVITADTFGLPIGAPNREGAIALLETMASVQGQIQFNRLKGSVTPRADIAATEFDTMTQGVMDDFARDTNVKALSGLLPGDIMSDLASELRASFEAGSTDIIRTYIEANYDSIP
jgi:glucose/mannose transport system substrate-binding protein